MKEVVVETITGQIGPVIVFVRGPSLKPIHKEIIKDPQSKIGVFVTQYFPLLMYHYEDQFYKEVIET